MNIIALIKLSNNDLDAAAIGAREIDDSFVAAVRCSSATCNLTCLGAVPIRAEVNNGMYEPWVEQCEPKRGYCSNNSSPCTQGSDCGGGNCIALGNGGWYCDKGGAIQCNNGTRGCPAGDTLTSCIGGDTEWLACGGDTKPPKPYNYLVIIKTAQLRIYGVGASDELKVESAKCKVLCYNV